MSSLIIAAAGAGKTTFLVKKALEISENVLITTYTVSFSLGAVWEIRLSLLL